MRSTYFSKAMTFLPLLLLAPILHAQSNDSTSTNPGVSKVRIVRLSQVRGSVQIDRSDGRGYERGIANLPIVEHNQVRTGVGIAEVEFEDNSSLRLAPNSVVEFPRLERACDWRDHLLRSPDRGDCLHQPGETAQRQGARMNSSWFLATERSISTLRRTFG